MTWHWLFIAPAIWVGLYALGLAAHRRSGSRAHHPYPSDGRVRMVGPDGQRVAFSPGAVSEPALLADGWRRETFEEFARAEAADLWGDGEDEPTATELAIERLRGQLDELMAEVREHRSVDAWPLPARDEIEEIARSSEERARLAEKWLARLKAARAELHSDRDPGDETKADEPAHAPNVSDETATVRPRQYRPVVVDDPAGGQVVRWVPRDETEVAS